MCFAPMSQEMRSILRPLRNSLRRVSWSVDASQCDQKSRIGVALLRR